MGELARRNLEVKARLSDLEGASRVVLGMGGREAGVLRQVDTYFRVGKGRLKLREIEGAGAELIAYERESREGVRGSDYYLICVEDAAEMKAGLEMTLGVLAEVRKERRVILWENVRVHLDRVEGLGDFVEFEAVISEQEGEEVSVERLNVLSEKLGVRETVAGSYAEMMADED